MIGILVEIYFLLRWVMGGVVGSGGGGGWGGGVGEG